MGARRNETHRKWTITGSALDCTPQERDHRAMMTRGSEALLAAMMKVKQG